MRTAILASLAGLLCVVATGCGHSENEGAEAAKREAEAERAKTAGDRVAATKATPPVPGGAKIPCDELIDADAFGKALGEKDPITVKDVTSSTSEATASCSLVRGGKPMSAAEQAAAIKQHGVLGVLGGDELCNVSAFCWTIEDPDHFKRRCAEQKLKDDDSMGTYACVQTVITGVHDVINYKFYDDDTKCILQVHGGPGMVDNAFIETCAKTARDLIGPNQIAVRPPGSGSAAGSGSGSAAP